MRIRTQVILASGVVAVVGGLVLSQVDTARWVGADPVASDDAGSGLRVLDASGESAAEQVVVQLVERSKPEGLKAGKVSAQVAEPYGLSCLDGPVAWTAARTRTLGGDTGAVTAAAYPAGAGGAAFAQVLQAAGGCADESEQPEYGTEALSYRKGESRVVVVRRGDVLATVSTAPADAMPDDAWLTGLDDRLAGLLKGVCLDDSASAEAVARNPYVDPEAFRGNVVAVPVEFPDVVISRAEDVSTDPAVPLDQAPLPVTPAVDRPEPLDPVAPDLEELPEEVPLPEAPTAPEEPDLAGSAPRAVADPDGPGCGWEFTGETAPAYDAEAAQGAHETAVRAEKERLVEDSVAFENGKVAYYRAWVEYRKAVETYATYATELASVRQSWEVVTTARAAFVEEFETYRRSVEAAEEWQAEREEAQTAYDAAVAACAARPPLEWLDPANGCPAPRPAILDEVAPEVLPRPVPAPEAQLPDGWEPPAAAADAEDEDD